MFSNDAPNRLSARVRGRVQGVGYRAFVREVARRYKITGWVRNTPDGGVDIIAEGDENTLTELLTELYRGPVQAHVRDIEIDWQHASREFEDFHIRR